ncbi:MerR family transcriptional regulator [Micromonospora halophytica]|uniref:DNA-binding transcriptional regulator, MerR family n=1 Tax=Micromonospora halophytica TaxID=47864 RepID=A0A1C5IVP1_9ACTN|nr:MerR family transcriptional regulator [Micromonospora halophytica]SCG62233.1 DNA-binding transcriptional regulator, MerR family [Micromonospora halophytica]
MGDGALMQIGEVAERTGLSLRTIRYYEEVGLIVPSARSQGGFRLYTHADVDRLQVVKRMKPLEFSLEQMRDLLAIVDRLSGGVRLAKAERERLLDTLAGYREAVHERCAALRAQLATAEEFAATLAGHMDALQSPTPSRATTNS